MATIAAPYRQSMGAVLEVNPESVDLFDPTIRGALSSKTKDGTPAIKSIWQFERELKDDPRWMRTDNAQDQAMGVGRQVLSDFGVLGG